MPMFECDPGIELNGTTAYAFISSLLTEEFMPILVRHGLNRIDTEQWYPLSKVLDVLKVIHTGDNASARLISIGIAAVDNLDLSPEIKEMSPVQFMKLYEQVFPTRHRNGSPGKITVDVLDENTAIATLAEDVAYPDDVMYGVFYAYARHLTKEGRHFTLEYLNDEGPTREFGGTETRIKLTVI